MSTILKQIADHHLLRGFFCQEIGLWEGKAGMSLFFFLLSRHTGNRWYEEFAGELLDDVCSNLSQHCPATFADGLCGIGWAVEFLKKEGFIEGDTDEILEEVDRQVMERDVRRITDASLETGLAGIVAYVRSRLKSQRTEEHSVFDNKYLEELDLSCERLNIDKCTSYYDLDVIWEKILSVYLDASETEENSWKKGVVMLNELTCSFSIDSLFAQEMSANSAWKTLLIFTEESDGASYGVGTYIKHLIQCFDLTEWDINVIEMFQSSINITFQSDKGVNYYGIPRINSEKYQQAVFFYLASRLNNKANVYCHFNFFGRDELATLFKESFNAHIVFTLHYMNWRFKLNGDVERVKTILHTPTNIEEERIKANFEKERNFMMNCCDSVIAVSQHSYVTLHNLYGIPLSKLTVISNAVQDFRNGNTSLSIELRKKYGFKGTEKIILFVGRLEKNKGIFDLISAFKQILKVIPDARLVIAGSGDFKKCMEAIYPFNKFVTFMGFMRQEQLQELYNIADIGVVPSYFEEFGYVAAEMMIHQCPVIVRNTTGLKEITENGKYASDFFSDNKLEEIIVKYLTNSQTSIISEEGKNRILENYSFNLFRERTIYAYSYLETPNSNINNLKLIES